MTQMTSTRKNGWRKKIYFKNQDDGPLLCLTKQIWWTRWVAKHAHVTCKKYTNQKQSARNTQQTKWSNKWNNKVTMMELEQQTQGNSDKLTIKWWWIQWWTKWQHNKVMVMEPSRKKEKHDGDIPRFKAPSPR
jgi:hypothetical protein